MTMVLAGSLFAIESSNPIQSILPALRLVLRKHWIKSLHIKRSKRPISKAIRSVFVWRKKQNKELNILSGGSHFVYLCRISAGWSSRYRIAF